MFSTEPSKMGNSTKADPPRLEMEQYWKSVWEKEASDNSRLRAECCNLPEQASQTLRTGQH